MYPVSEKFKTAIQDNSRSFYFEGKITTKAGITYPFGNADIVKGSGYITRQCCGGTEIELGTVYAGELGITLYSDIDRYSLEGGTIELFFYLDIGSSYEKVPMGIFEISEANRTINCLEIKAYDYMLRFDKDIKTDISSGTAYDYLILACNECKVELAHTQEEIAAMPSGSITLSIYSENDIDTWRDFIFYVAQLLGCFAIINRSGKLELKKYGNQSVMNIPNTQRFSSSFSDFVTRYTAVSSTNIKTKESEYYALEADDGLTMNLGVNPLLQFGLKETREEILNNILSDISKINYVPFYSTTIGNPALDVGDVLTFSGGHADGEQITAITSITYKVNGKHSLKCVGKNPRLSQAKSKNDKNISGLVNSIEAGKIAVHRYINASRFTINSTNTEIISIEFASNIETDAEFKASILLTVNANQVDVTRQATGTIKVNGGTTQSVNSTLTWKEDGNAIIYVTYQVNDNEITNYYPIENFKSGDHILNLYYPLNGLQSNTFNTFRVLIKIVGGSAIVERSQVMATISGQGLSANVNWDGRLEMSEITGTFKMGGNLSIHSFDTTNLAQLIQPSLTGIDEAFVPVSFGGIGVIHFNEEIDIN